MKLCKEADSADEAARRIARNPALLAECREKVALVQRLARGATPEQIYVELQPMLVLYGPPDFGSGKEADALQAAWMDVYVKALKDVPREALEFAVSEHIRVGKPFFPKPTELNKLANEKAIEARLLAWRVRKAAEQAAADERFKARPTPEERERVRRMAAEFTGRTLPGDPSPRPQDAQHQMAEDLRRAADDQ